MFFILSTRASFCVKTFSPSKSFGYIGKDNIILSFKLSMTIMIVGLINFASGMLSSSF